MSSPANSNGDQKEEQHDADEKNEVSTKADKKDMINEGDSEKEDDKKKSEKSEDDSDKGKGDDDDEEEEDEEENEVGLLDRPVEVSGSRDRKKVQRLELTFNTTKEKPEFPEGTGEKLGDCPRIEYQIQRNSVEELKPLHKILFVRPGSGPQSKRNIRKFNGFPFKKKSNECDKKKAAMDKMTNANLKHVCEVLDLERSGTKEDIVIRILDFLLEPKPSGKAVPIPKKKSAGKGVKRKQTKKSNDSKKSAEKVESSNDVNSSIEDVKSHDDNEEPKKKRAKSAPKSPAKKESSKKTAKKQATKRSAKKTDSSDERSSDDEPLVKMSKSPPTNEEIKTYIKKVLKAADLQKVTMKTVIQQVYDHYPDFELASRKDFIKSTVKSVIS